MSDNIPVPYYGEIKQEGGYLLPMLPDFGRRVVVAPADPVFVNPSDGQLLGGPFGKYNTTPVPVPLLGLNPFLMITSDNINRFEHYEAIKETFKEIRKDLGTPYKSRNNKGGFVMWKDNKISHVVKDFNVNPNILYTKVVLKDGVVTESVNNTNQFFEPETRVLKVRGPSVNENYKTILTLIGKSDQGDKTKNRNLILQNVV